MILESGEEPVSGNYLLEADCGWMTACHTGEWDGGIVSLTVYVHGGQHHGHLGATSFVVAGGRKEQVILGRQKHAKVRGVTQTHVRETF